MNRLWRDRGVENKHTKLSERKEKQDHYKPVSTDQVHFMHRKTFSESRNNDERKHTRRKCYSNNNLTDIQEIHTNDRGISSNWNLTSQQNAALKHEHSPKTTKNTLFRPKSLNRLTSLFNNCTYLLLVAEMIS